MAKSLALSTVLFGAVCQRMSILKCCLLDTDETGTEWSVNYVCANMLRQLNTVIANSKLIW